MTFIGILFALFMLALWGAAVAGIWVFIGPLGGLAFAGVTVVLYRVVGRLPDRRMTPDSLNAFQQPLAQSKDDPGPGQ